MSKCSTSARSVRSSPPGGIVVRLALLLALAAAVLWGGGTIAPASAGVFNPHIFSLPNGLQVVVIENRRLPVVRQMVFYRVGAADDPPGKSGLAHYLEHLMFRGTTSIPPGEFSRIVARNGGRDNAFTSADVTAYFQTFSKDRLELMMRIEADRMANLVISPKEAVPELQVVIEERRTRTDNQPSAQLDEHIAAALYMNHPYRTPLIGWMHEIQTLTAADAIAFYRQHYAPNNAILVLAGDISVDDVRPLVEKYYGVIPANPSIVSRTRLQEPPQRAERRVSMRSDSVREPRLTRAYLSPTHLSGETRHAYPLEVLSTILGGGATSRLYRALVVDGNLAIGVNAGYNSDAFGPTAFAFAVRPRAGVGLDRIEAALDKEIERVLADGITEEELTSAKKRMVDAAIFARDGLREGPSAIGMTLAAGRPIADVEEWPERIAAVTRTQVLEAARHVFRRERSVTGLLLPGKPAEQAEDVPLRERARTGRTAPETSQ